MSKKRESAVSPVVGVMLMLVVVIIIAAVVSGFAGGLVSSNSNKAPQLTMDVRLANGGYWSNSFLMMTVTAVDSAIPTKDLKIVTSWSKVLPNGTQITGGTTVIPGTYNYHVYYWVSGWASSDDWYAVAPLGYGAGVANLNSTSVDAGFWPFEQVDTSKCAVSKMCQFEDVNNIALGNMSWFGNYNLKSGTIMFARPFGGAYGSTKDQSGAYDVGYGMAGNTTASGVTTGGSRYYYSYGSSYNAHPGTTPSGATALFYDTVGLDSGQSEDMMMGMLGANWNYLRAGDIVNIKIVHTPSGKTIFNKDVTVEG